LSPPYLVMGNLSVPSISLEVLGTAYKLKLNFDDAVVILAYHERNLWKFNHLDVPRKPILYANMCKNIRVLNIMLRDQNLIDVLRYLVVKMFD
jgi:hypothetical protein